MLTVIQSVSSRDGILIELIKLQCAYKSLMDLVKISDSVGLRRGGDSAFLTSSQEMLKLLVLRAHFEQLENTVPDL